MELLVDGYNILKIYSPAHYIDKRDRDAFIKKLAAYANLKSLKIVVVFDGGDATYPYVERKGVLAVWYSGLKTADDVLKQLLHEKRGQDILLISSDRELVDVARGYSVESLGAREFYSYVHDALAPIIKARSLQTTPLKRFGSQNDREIDELMQGVADAMSSSFKKTVDNDPCGRKDGSRNREQSGSSVSKKERSMHKKLKKL